MAKHGAHRATPKRAPVSKAGQKRVSAKISHLHKTEPEMPHEQKVAMSLEMERAHRLGPGGAYKHVAKARAARATRAKRR